MGSDIKLRAHAQTWRDVSVPREVMGDYELIETLPRVAMDQLSGMIDRRSSSNSRRSPRVWSKYNASSRGCVAKGDDESKVEFD